MRDRDRDRDPSHGQLVASRMHGQLVASRMHGQQFHLNFKCPLLRDPSHGHVTSNNLICTGHVVPLRDRDRDRAKHHGHGHARRGA